MADQQNLPPDDSDHLAIARNLLAHHPNGYRLEGDTAQAHALLDIAESLRHLRPGVVAPAAEPGAPRTVPIREEDWLAVLSALERLVDDGMYAPSSVIDALRTAIRSRSG